MFPDSGVALYSVLFFNSAYAVRIVLLINATVTTFSGFLASSALIHTSFSVLASRVFTLLTTEKAPWYKAARKFLCADVFDVEPILTFPPELCCTSVAPKQAEASLPLIKESAASDRVLK